VINSWSRRTAPCCLSAVGFRPALPAPDKELSPHPALQLRLLLAFSHSPSFDFESLLLSLRFSECPEFLDPFPLSSGFPEALDGRYSVGYYGSAAPTRSLVTCPPIPSGSSCRFRRCSHSNFSVSLRCPSVTLVTCAQAREAYP